MAANIARGIETEGIESVAVSTSAELDAVRADA
jgi:hypothetical protein